MRVRNILLAAVAGGWLGAALPAYAGSYTFSSIIVDSASAVLPSAINNHGLVVGTYVEEPDPILHGFVLADGVVTVLPAYSMLGGVNDEGIAVGGDGSLLVYRIRDGLSRTLLPKSASTFGVGINARNEILAEVDVGPTNSSACPLVIAQGSRMRLVPPGHVSAVPVAIDRAGDVLGVSPTAGAFGFVYRNGTYEIIPKPFPTAKPGFSRSYFTGLSEDGAVLGYAYGQRAPGSGKPSEVGFVYQGGVFDPVAYPGALGTQPAAVVGANLVVGSYFDSAPEYTHGFVRLAGQYYPIDFPGAISTHVTAANQEQSLVGFYSDSLPFLRGFVATCAADQRPCTR